MNIEEQLEEEEIKYYSLHIKKQKRLKQQNKIKKFKKDINFDSFDIKKPFKN